jgi:hypothetical protein
MAIEIINLTPHQINLFLANGEQQSVPASGRVARVSVKSGQPREVEGIPVPVLPAPEYGAVEGLPEPQPGKVYLVSAMVLARCTGRLDVFAPATGPQDGAVRDEGGRIVGVTKLLAAPME